MIEDNLAIINALIKYYKHNYKLAKLKKKIILVIQNIELDQEKMVAGCGWMKILPVCVLFVCSLPMKYNTTTGTKLFGYESFD